MAPRERLRTRVLRDLDERGPPHVLAARVRHVHAQHVEAGVDVTAPSSNPPASAESISFIVSSTFAVTRLRRCIRKRAARLVGFSRQTQTGGIDRRLPADLPADAAVIARIGGLTGSRFIRTEPDAAA